MDSEASGNAPIVIFYRMIADAPLPIRADRTAGGTMPLRAARYCDAITAASAFGWWVFPPLDFRLLWDGNQVFWTYDAVAEWLPLQAAQFPHFAADFDAIVPDDVRGFSPPFLTALPEPGSVQIWSGLVARTAPEWSSLVRAPANLPNGGGFITYEGIVETDRWFGPLFINLRLTRTSVPVSIKRDMPLIQLQPLHRITYAEENLSAMRLVSDLSAFNETDWADYRRTIVHPSQDMDRMPGGYATTARQRRKREKCSFAGHVGGRPG